MSDLTIKHAVKPFFLPVSIYDVKTEHICEPSQSPLITPTSYNLELDLLSGGTFVLRTGRKTMRSGTMFTGWETTVANFEVADWENPRSRWQLTDGENVLWYATYGLLPSAYTKSKYRLAEIDYLYMVGNWYSQLLWDDGVPSSTGIIISDNGSKPNIRYKATVTNIATGEPEVLTGTSTSYSYGRKNAVANALVYFDPGTGYPDVRGDCKGYIKLTETPSEWEE